MSVVVSKHTLVTCENGTHFGRKPTSKPKLISAKRVAIVERKEYRKRLFESNSTRSSSRSRRGNDGWKIFQNGQLLRSRGRNASACRAYCCVKTVRFRSGKRFRNGFRVSLIEPTTGLPGAESSGRENRAAIVSSSSLVLPSASQAVESTAERSVLCVKLQKIVLEETNPVRGRW